MKKALVLGIRGAVGGAVAEALVAQGWKVSGLVRGNLPPAGPFEYIQGDAMVAADVARAARGADVIFHGVNPPGYQRWSELVVPMIDNTIAAARAAGARIVVPGNVYNFGPGERAFVAEEAPQRPTTRKGAVRVEMERRLEAAARTGTPSLIVRAGDFFGPKGVNNWFAQGLVAFGKPVKTIRRPSAPGIGHQWNYLPDVAQTIVKLLERADRLEPFARFHMGGHWDADGAQLPEAIARAVRRADPAARPVIRPFPWWMVPVGSPFVPFMREMLEMRYLWSEPVRLNNARLLAFLGTEPHTPLDEAVEETLAGLGCLSKPRVRSLSHLAA